MSELATMPEIEELRLDEAVDLIVEMGLVVGDVRLALERALCEGRLRELPWLVMSPDRILEHARMAAKDGSLSRAEVGQLEEAGTPGRFTAIAWQQIFRTGAANWDTGEVVRRRWTLVPRFGRGDIMTLFGMSEPSNEPRRKSEKINKLQCWYVDIWIPSWQDRPRNRDEDLTAARKQLGGWVTMPMINAARATPNIKRHLPKRGRPKNSFRI